jgi:hypothetical protein
VPLLADPDEKAALRRSADHVAVQYEAQPAEHPDFPQLTIPRESCPHAVGEIFIHSHEAFPR